MSCEWEDAVGHAGEGEETDPMLLLLDFAAEFWVDDVRTARASLDTGLCSLFPSLSEGRTM